MIEGALLLYAWRLARLGPSDQNLATRRIGIERLELVGRQDNAPNRTAAIKAGASPISNNFSNIELPGERLAPAFSEHRDSRIAKLTRKISAVQRARRVLFRQQSLDRFSVSLRCEVR